MNFPHEKKQFLSKPDKSFAGGIDEAILPLCRLINSKQDYYTTSSCAGRILLIKETEKKQEKVFLFITHKKTSLSEIKKVLSKIKSKELIYFKHEPVILHAACKNLADAFSLVNKALNAGWKKSGIISKNNRVELVSTEILAAPIMKNGKMLIDENYLKFLIQEANIKLSKTRKKISNLSKALK